MPRVKQEKITLGLDPARPRAETVVYTNYDNKADRYGAEPQGGRFWIGLPGIMSEVIGKREVRGKTQEAARKAFMDVLEKFKNIKVETRKVILYQIHCRRKAGDSRWSSDFGYEIKIWAGVYIETVALSGSGIGRYSYEEVNSTLKYPGSCSEVEQARGTKFKAQVPWTEQNEAFFKWVEDRMNGLINALADIAEPAKLIESINSGKLLPLGRSDTAGVEDA